MGVSCRQILLYLLAFGVAGSAQAQVQNVTFERIMLPGGAYGNYVTSITQDDQGFMWFGTWGGLHKFDGYQVTTFRHQPDDATTLPDTWVECLYVDRTGTLWAGTFGGGLARFNRETETFTSFRHDANDSTSLSHDVVTVLLEDRHGSLWIGTHGGLNRFEQESETFTRYRYDADDPTGLSDNQVRALYEDRQGALWVGTGSPSDPPDGLSGLNRFDRERGTFTRYLHAPDDENSLVDGQVRALYEDTQGRFWVGTWGDGLHTMDRARGTFTRHLYDASAPGRLSRPHLRDDSGNGGVSFVHEDGSGVLWIGAVNGGLNRYDPSTGTLTHYEHDADDPTSLSDNRVWTIFESRDGSLWIGALGGLHKVNPAESQFPYYTLEAAGSNNNVRALFEDPFGILWIGTSRGLYRLNRETGEITNDLDGAEDAGRLVSQRVLAVYRDREGRVWISTMGGGLDRYDPSTGTLMHYEHDADDPTGLSGNTVRAIYEDRQGTLWIGTQTAGLNRFERDTQTFFHYVHDPDNPHSLSHNSVQVLFEDQAGTLWIGTDGGLNRLNRETETPGSGPGQAFARYVYEPADPRSLSDNVVLSISEAPSGTLWIGTESGGLNRLDRATGTFTRYTSGTSGLPDNQVLGILADDHGNLWLSTGQGLTTLNPETNTFHRYGASRGLPAEPFYTGAYHKSRSGELFFGGRNGFHAFFPEHIRIEVNPQPPHVALTDFRLFGQPVRPGPQSPLGVSISEATEVTLSHRQNDLSFGFAALHYSYPAKNQYAFKLEPYEDSWREVGFERRATYTNLDPGAYVFRVKASNSDGVWNEEGVSLRLNIAPPFWARWWFQALVLAALFGLVFGGYRLRVTQIKAHNRVLEREVAERTADLNQALHNLTETQEQLVHAQKMAALGHLTAGIAHEIQNPLNFVTNFAQLSAELADDLGEELNATRGRLSAEKADNLSEILTNLKENARRINKHGERADGIVKSMMQHARGGAGRREPTNLNALLEESVNLSYHGIRVRMPSFEVTIKRDYDEALGTVEVVPQEMGRVFLNLLDNAFYAVHEQAQTTNGPYTPTVTVSTQCVKGSADAATSASSAKTVFIRVSDNGPGIPDEVRDRVFEPFFTTKPPGRGMGLGLSLSYDIVTQGHGGTLVVESTAGEGTTFEITLLDRHSQQKEVTHSVD